MGQIAEFLGNNKEPLAVLANLATLIALVFTGLALVFTGIQVRKNQHQTRANTIYTIQKDARDFIAELIKKPELWRAIHAQDENYPPEVDWTIGQMLNFYSAIHHQFRLGVLDQRTWHPFENELMQMFSFPKPRRFWCLKRSEGQYDPEFTALIDTIVNSAVEHPTQRKDANLANSSKHRGFVTMGPYNQTNHETAQISSRAAAELMEGLSCLFKMIAAIESQDIAAFQTFQKEAINRCEVSSDLFQYTSTVLTDRVYAEPPVGSEEARLFEQLRDVGFGPPFNNRSLGTISASEIERFKIALSQLKFEAPGDQTIRDALDAESRLLRVGLVVSRLAALNPV